MQPLFNKSNKEKIVTIENDNDKVNINAIYDITSSLQITN